MRSLTAEILDANRAGDRARADKLELKLTEVDPYAVPSDSERLAFWINLYNAKVIEEFSVRPRKGSLLRHWRVFDKASYRVGGDEFSLNVIEHGLLRRNSRPPNRPWRALRKGDPRNRAAPSRLDPRIHFALNCAATSCPPIQAYAAEQVERQLDTATRAYFQAESEFDPGAGKLTLPYLMKLYAADFGGKTPHEQWALPYLSGDAQAAMGSNERGRNDVSVGYADYDWTISL